MAVLAGLDVGSLLAKAVILDEAEGILAHSVRLVAGNFQTAARDVLNAALDNCGLTAGTVASLGTTGLGAGFVNGPSLRNTEISCQARGVHYLLPRAGSVIEIGDQSTRVIRLTGQGKVADCVISDKCAMGSGRVLQVIARVLRITLEEMGGLSQEATRPVSFSTGCSVFVETEVISRIAEGAGVADIVGGLHRAMAVKIGGMADKARLEGDIAAAGGGACDPGLVKMLEKVIGQKVLVVDRPLLTGAVGAALMAAESRGRG